MIAAEGIMANVCGIVGVDGKARANGDDCSLPALPLAPLEVRKQTFQIS
jgi:hypothetical protein